MGTSTTSAAPSSSGAAANPERRFRVLVVDSRHDRRLLMGSVLDQSGPDVGVVGYADSPISAVKAVEALGANSVVLEVQIPIEQGLDAVSALRARFPGLTIVVCSFRADSSTKQAATERGASAYLVKPFSLRDLRCALRSGPGVPSDLMAPPIDR